MYRIASTGSAEGAGALHDLVFAAHRLIVHVGGFVEHLAAGLGPTDWLVLAVMLTLGHLSGRVGIWAYCLVSLPGTLAHELAHWVTALVLRASPSLPSIIPQRMKSGAWRLGSVGFSAGLIRSVPIALAPLALAPLSIWWAGAHLPGLPFGPMYLLHAWIASTAFAASLPSSQDWSIAAPTLGAVAMLTALILLG